MDDTFDYKVALAQFVKTKRAEVRLRHTLMADAEIATSIEGWKAEFAARALQERPQVLSLHSELRRLTTGEPS